MTTNQGRNTRKHLPLDVLRRQKNKVYIILLNKIEVKNATKSSQRLAHLQDFTLVVQFQVLVTSDMSHFGTNFKIEIHGAPFLSSK